ncbi:MAG: hypothetical protein RIQ93_2650 [Verrucomicrobiota bacterium]|jgi:exopolyphosphatase/guanosine-5'-triphosphate,3'-diphosphate pyrophosphatase
MNSLSGSSPRVAVIDIGSNSIKSLVAVTAPDGSVHGLHSRTINARISAGISQSAPELSEAGMMRGLDAIRTLLADAAVHAPARILLVATSAVRDARNGAEFRERVRVATGHTIRILSGDEEATFIGRGVTGDPALLGVRSFYLFDLGGGSLECLAFQERQIAQAFSLQLGCVRLTEKFVADPAAPFSPDSAALIAAHTRAEFSRASFAFSLKAGSAAVGAGGTVATVRAILGERAGLRFEQTSPVVTVAQLRDLLAWLGSLSLAERQQVPGLPAARADVYPAALATLLTIAEMGALTAFQNTLHSLRYGIAAEALAATSR